MQYIIYITLHVDKVLVWCVGFMKVKATANLGPAAKDGILATVQDCLKKGADVDVRAAVSGDI